MPCDELEPRRVEPVYRTRADTSGILLYGGPVEVETVSNRDVIDGQVELCLFPRSSLVVRLAGPAAVLMSLGWPVEARSVRLPPGASLEPPAEPTLPTKPETGSWGEDAIFVDQLDAGDVSLGRRFVVHLSRSVRRPRVRGIAQTSDGTYQSQVRFQLDGWGLVFVAHESEDERGFGAVIEATPPGETVDTGAVEALAHRLFVLLSLVSNREVGVGPICGFDKDDALVWVRWTAPRLRAGKAPVGWCARHLMPHALQSLAKGLSEIPTHSAQEAVMDRAVNYLLFADSDEILDVRITMACAGLELLSWAILRDEGWLRQESLGSRRLTAASTVRLLLQWARLDPDLPDGFSALIARRKRLGDATLGAAEVIFNVRNRIIHPPKNLDDPEWPGLDELFEAWKLATWALELVLLRVLSYHGSYWSRLQIPRSEMDVEPVPWAARDPASDGWI